MPNLNHSNESKMAETLNDQIGSLTVSTQPVVVCGVQRKANTGNYENIDVYCAVSMPVDLTEGMDLEQIREMIGSKADECMKIAAQETRKNYEKIKSQN